MTQGLSLISSVFKMSLGDTNFTAFSTTELASNIFVLFIWYMLVLFLHVIMLNFVIAVVGETYEEVKTVHL